MKTPDDTFGLVAKMARTIAVKHTTNKHDGRDYTIRKSLKEITDKLPKDRFLRVHKSFVVLVDAVTAIDTNFVYLGEKKIPIGRSYYNAFTAHAKYD